MKSTRLQVVAKQLLAETESIKDPRDISIAMISAALLYTVNETLNEIKDLLEEE